MVKSFRTSVPDDAWPAARARGGPNLPPSVWGDSCVSRRASSGTHQSRCRPETAYREHQSWYAYRHSALAGRETKKRASGAFPPDRVIPEVFESASAAIIREHVF